MSGGTLPAAIAYARLKTGENRLPCPVCDRGPKDTALSVRLEPDGVIVWHCHRLCGMDGSNRSRDTTPTTPRLQSAPRPVERKRGLSDNARALWAATVPPKTCRPAADYLRARVCMLPPDDGDLRCMPALRHPSGYIGPALVALITDTLTGEPLSLHRTWIQADGQKAPVSPARLLLKDHPIAGGVIRLWPDDAVTMGLGIAEGIETALSLAHGFAPVWACIDAGHLAKFPILPGIQELIIGADNDPAGRKAADACAARWGDHAAVRVIQADTDGADLNDEVRSWVM